MYLSFHKYDLFIIVVIIVMSFLFIFIIVMFKCVGTE